MNRSIFETKLVQNGDQRRYLSSSYFLFQIRNSQLWIMIKIVEKWLKNQCEDTMTSRITMNAWRVLIKYLWLPNFLESAYITPRCMLLKWSDYSYVFSKLCEIIIIWWRHLWYLIIWLDVVGCCGRVCECCNNSTQLDILTNWAASLTRSICNDCW